VRKAARGFPRGSLTDAVLVQKNEKGMKTERAS